MVLPEGRGHAAGRLVAGRLGARPSTSTETPDTWAIAGTVAAALANLGLDVLLPDYRGYGASEGKPSEEGLYADARAAYRWLVEEEGVDPGHLIVFGNSLGSAVAADLAIGRPVAGVVLLGPFTDIPSIARHRLSWLPEWYLDWRSPRFDTRDRASRIEAPTLVGAGAEDRVIPPGQSRAVYEALAAPRRWLEVPGAGHNDIFSQQALWQALHRFTREVLPGNAGGLTASDRGDCGTQLLPGPEGQSRPPPRRPGEADGRARPTFFERRSAVSI